MSSLYECAADCCRVQAMRGLCGGSIIQISLFLVKFEMECPPLKFLISPPQYFWRALTFLPAHPPPSCGSRASRVSNSHFYADQSKPPRSLGAL